MVELHINYYAFIPIFEQIINVTIHYNHKGCTWKSFLKNEHFRIISSALARQSLITIIQSGTAKLGSNMQN